MAQLLAAALSFPGVVYTVLLGVVLLYWLFVVVGAVGVDLLGEGALDGGGADGALEGASKGAAEAALGGQAGAHEGGPGAGSEGAPGGHGAGGWLGALHLRSAPATVVASLLVAFSWLASVVAGSALDAWGPGGGARWALGTLALVLAPAASLPATALIVRPLARLFATHPAARGRRDFVGKICTVRTGTVDEAFGEAVLAERGAEVIVRVRLDGAGELGRGERALIIAFDEARDAFLVAPFDAFDAFDERAGGKRAPGRGGAAG